MASNMNSKTFLEAAEQLERRELKEWLEFDRRYPSPEEKLRAQVKAAFPGIRYADEEI